MIPPSKHSTPEQLRLWWQQVNTELDVGKAVEVSSLPATAQVGRISILMTSGTLTLPAPVDGGFIGVKCWAPPSVIIGLIDDQDSVTLVTKGESLILVGTSTAWWRL